MSKLTWGTRHVSRVTTHIMCHELTLLVQREQVYCVQGPCVWAPLHFGVATQQ